MPRDENGDKWACEPCVRGHRSSKCEHFERLMIRVKKPGRPLSQCPHPPGECNCHFERVMMVRIDRQNEDGNTVGCTCQAKYYVDKSGARKAVGPHGQVLPIPYVPAGDDAKMEDTEFNFNAPMQPPTDAQRQPTGDEQAAADFVFNREQPVHQQQMRFHSISQHDVPAPFGAAHRDFQVFQGFQQPQPQPAQFRPAQFQQAEPQQAQLVTIQSQEPFPQENELPNQPTPDGFGFAPLETRLPKSKNKEATKSSKKPTKTAQGYRLPAKAVTENQRDIGSIAPSQSLHLKEEQGQAQTIKVEENGNQPNGSSSANCCADSAKGDGNLGLRKAGAPEVFEHFRDLAQHPLFHNHAAMENLQSRARHSHATADSCLCGPGCTCFGCLSHPFNLGTQHRMENLQALMMEESQETPSPINTQTGSLGSLQEPAAKFNVLGGMESALAPEPTLGFELAAPPQLPQGTTEQGFSMTTTDRETFIYYYPQDDPTVADPSAYGPVQQPSGDYACVDPMILQANAPMMQTNDPILQAKDPMLQANDPMLMETNGMNVNGSEEVVFDNFVHDMDGFVAPQEQFTDDNEALAPFYSAHADAPIS